MRLQMIIMTIPFIVMPFFALAQVPASYKCNVLANQTGDIVWTGNVDNLHTFSISDVRGSDKVQQLDRYDSSGIAALKNTKVLLNFDRYLPGNKINITDELSGTVVWAKDHVSISHKKSDYIVTCMTLDYKE